MTAPALTLDDLADIALDNNVIVVTNDLIILPDLVVMEDFVNGHHLPEGWSGTRDDGRSVRVYSIPDIIEDEEESA